MVIEEHQYFYASNGEVLKSKTELLNFLRRIDEKTFFNHVNAEKNDFASWIGEIFREKRLSKKMDKTKNIEELISILEESKKKKEGKKRDKKGIISQIVNAIKNG